MIDLRKFVKIDIKQTVDTSVSGTRDVTALFTSYGVKGQPNIVTSYADARKEYSDVNEDDILMKYIKMYFDNGGAKLAIYNGYASVEPGDIKSLPDEYINVCFANLSYSSIKLLAEDLANDTTVYGIKEKILFARTTDVDDDDKIKNFAVKCSQVEGAEMTMSAYLSKIDVYGIETVSDYAFTQEHLNATTISNSPINDEQFDNAMTNNINVDVRLANAVRACGGNCKDGAELTNNFVRIILHQTVTARLIELLSQKIKSNTGIGKIYSTIAQELTYYLSCGYLTTDKVWLKDDLTVTTTDGNVYTIIEKGTALTNGYVLKVLPLSSLTESEKEQHQAPQIYIIVADQYAIRKIVINGEVI